MSSFQNPYDQTNLTPGEQERIARLNTQFNQYFGHGVSGYSGFGANEVFRKTYGMERGQAGVDQGFDISRYRQDPQYRQFVEKMAGQNPVARKSLDDILNFYEQRPGGYQAFQSTDLSKIFDPLRGEIGKISDESLQRAKGEISKSTAGAEERATEALAGTGLGRSGVAQEGFADIGKQRIQAIENVTAAAEQRRSEAMLNLEFQKAQLQYQEELSKRNFSHEQIQDALGFDRTLFQMQFGAALQESMQPDEPGFFESFLGSVLPTALNIGAGFLVGGPAGAIAGGVAGFSGGGFAGGSR